LDLLEIDGILLASKLLILPRSTRVFLDFNPTRFRPQKYENLSFQPSAGHRGQASSTGWWAAWRRVERSWAEGCVDRPLPWNLNTWNPSV